MIADGKSGKEEKIDEGKDEKGTGDEETDDEGTGDEGKGDERTEDEGKGDEGKGDEGTGAEGKGAEGTVGGGCLPGRISHCRCCLHAPSTPAFQPGKEVYFTLINLQIINNRRGDLC